MPEPEEPPLPEYDASWNPATLELIYRECSAFMPQLYREMEAVDTKTVAIFTLGSAVIGLGPALSGSKPDSVDGWLLWILAGIAWLFCVGHAYMAYKPREVMIGPKPHQVRHRDWLVLEPEHYHAFRLRDMAVTAQSCFTAINSKVWHFQRALVAVGFEVALAALAILRG